MTKRSPTVKPLCCWSSTGYYVTALGLHVWQHKEEKIWIGITDYWLSRNIVPGKFFIANLYNSYRCSLIFSVGLFGCWQFFVLGSKILCPNQYIALDRLHNEGSTLAVDEGISVESNQDHVIVVLSILLIYKWKS